MSVIPHALVVRSGRILIGFVVLASALTLAASWMVLPPG